MHGNNILLIVFFTVLLFVDEDLGSIISTPPNSTDPVCKDNETYTASCPMWTSMRFCEEGHQFYSFMSANCPWTCGFCETQQGSKSCSVVADVVVVFEIPAGRKDVAGEIRSFFRKLRATLNPSPSCIRLSFILAWKEVDTIVQFNCNYDHRARCVTSADNSLTSLGYKFPNTREFDKNNLVKAIDSADSLLFSTRQGARSGVKKVCLLILNSGPKKDVIPTEDAVKNLHDEGVVLITVGIREGGRENMNEIVMFRKYAVNVPSIRALNSTRIIKQLESLVIQPYEAEDITPPPPTAIGKAADLPFDAPLEGPPEQTPLPMMVEDDLKETCTYLVDIGFLVDSSGSLRRHYGKEKFFVRRIATKFNISEAGSHAGLVLFSARNYVKTVIQFNDHTNLKDFNNAVEHIPYYGYLTRIDLALDKAHEELFTLKDGARPNVRQVAFLITDGRQNPDIENGVLIDPDLHAAPLHNRGINIFAVGVGERINFTELAMITRSKERVFTVKNFDELISDEFVESVSEKMCKAAILPKKNVTTATKPTTTPKPAEQLQNTTTSPPIQLTPNPCKKSCFSCDCGGGDCCGCCDQKADVYINVFSGDNSKNYVSQGMKVTQSGNSEAKSEIGFPKSNDNGVTVKQNTKDMSTNEIAALIKDCLPYQTKMKEGIKELLRRSLQAQTNNPNIQKNKKRKK